MYRKQPLLDHAVTSELLAVGLEAQARLLAKGSFSVHGQSPESGTGLHPKAQGLLPSQTEGGAADSFSKELLGECL